MFGGMSKNFRNLRVSFFMNLKVASKKLDQVSLFHTTKKIKYSLRNQILQEHIDSIIIGIILPKQLKDFQRLALS